jgi:hypothetical protein
LGRFGGSALKIAGPDPLDNLLEPGAADGVSEQTLDQEDAVSDTCVMPAWVARQGKQPRDHVERQRGFALEPKMALARIVPEQIRRNVPRQDDPRQIRSSPQIRFRKLEFFANACDDPLGGGCGTHQPSPFDSVLRANFASRILAFKSEKVN